MQIKIRYRFQDFTFSDPLNIVLNKQFSNDEHIFYKKISNDQNIKKYVKD